MRRRSVLTVQLAFYLLLLSATFCGQAVVPNPADIAPIINPPVPQNNNVISLASYMTPGVTVHDALKQALLDCRQQHPAKLVIPTGRYVFDDPKAVQDRFHIGVFGQRDLIIDAQGSEFIFHFPFIGIGFADDQRVIIRKLIIDTDLQLASLGVVQKVGGNTNIRILDAYPVNASTAVVSVSRYDIQNMKLRAVPGEVFFPKDAVIKNILFEGNTISRTPGLALFISSASGITVSNNVIINSNTLGAFPPSYGSAIGVIAHGSIMVTKASKVLITGNLQLTTPQQTEQRVFIDQQTTSGITSRAVTWIRCRPRSLTIHGSTSANTTLIFSAGFRI